MEKQSEEMFNKDTYCNNDMVNARKRLRQEYDSYKASLDELHSYRICKDCSEFIGREQPRLDRPKDGICDICGARAETTHLTITKGEMEQICRTYRLRHPNDKKTTEEAESTKERFNLSMERYERDMADDNANVFQAYNRTMNDTLKEALKQTSYCPFPSDDKPDLKTTGEARVWASGSKRDCRDGKGRYDLISPIALKALALRLEQGAKHYGERNWEKGQNLCSYADSLIRHLMQFLEGLKDEDHLGAVMYNAMALTHTAQLVKDGKLPKDLDDRVKI